MAITYTFDIEKLEGAPTLNGKDKVVCGVLYKLQGVADDGTESNVLAFLRVEYDENNFIEFDDLKESDVKGWVNAATAELDSYKKHIEVAIEELQPPKKVDLPKPW